MVGHGAAAVAHPMMLARPRFVGRGPELAQILRALQAPPAVVLIEGEAGIGKSRLVQEVLEHRQAAAGGHRTTAAKVLVATCPPFREPFTLGPVVDALRETTDSVGDLGLTALAGALRPMFPEWADGLPPLPEQLDDPSAARHRLFRALAELLDRLSVELLVVEDVHWSDQATIEFLIFLMSRRPAHGSPAARSLLCTYRPEDLPADSLLLRLTSRFTGTNQLTVTLGPLGMAATAEMLSSMLAGEPMSTEFVTFMHDGTDGVPLAVEESLRLLQDRSDLTHRDGEWVRRRLDQIAVPPRVRDSVLERVGRMSDAARAVVEAAAVLTDPSAEPTIAEVAGLEPSVFREGMGEALDAGVLGSNARRLIAFRHVLACRAVYDDLPSPRRGELHRRAGVALEHSPIAQNAALARHFREAGETDGWVRYAEQAAALARSSGDVATSDGLLYDVVVHAELPGAARAELADKISLSLVGPDRYLALAEVLGQALGNEMTDAATEGEIRYQRGRFLTSVDEYAAANDELRRSVPLLDHRPDWGARALLLLGHPRGTDLPATEHLGWLLRAAAAIETLPALQQLRHRVDLATSLLALGENRGWEEAARIPEHPESERGLESISRAQINFSHFATAWGRYAQAAHHLQLAGELTAEGRHARFRDIVMVNRARLDWFAGRWQGLVSRAERLAGNEDLQPVSRIESSLIVAQLHIADGNVAAAEPRLSECLRQAWRHGALAESMEIAGALGALHLEIGRPAEALSVTEEPMKGLTLKGIWLWATELLPVRVQALVDVGELGAAAALCDLFEGGAAGLQAPGPLAALADCRAVLLEGQGDAAGAIDAFDAAATRWQAMSRPYDSWRAKERRASTLLAVGRKDAAAAGFSEVFDGFAGLDARGPATRVLAALRELGVDVKRPWWGGSKGYGSRLSPRELEVAGLVVDGRTTKEIARLLSRSPHTVASQLNSAMRKLEVSSRTALAVAVVDAGLLPAPADPVD
ncbi:helix-turn-helix transcriptional regulator [Nakamurella lactea]|uniref:helix-turn-helix transcriptional regulator n=1 Tax=Nakamurella lactea TaxID=459515 RepID=UPI00040A91E3|nr:AAA family ATPase [Nakamurella lactea]